MLRILVFLTVAFQLSSCSTDPYPKDYQANSQNHFFVIYRTISLFVINSRLGLFDLESKEVNYEFLTFRQFEQVVNVKDEIWFTKTFTEDGTNQISARDAKSFHFVENFKVVDFTRIHAFENSVFLIEEDTVKIMNAATRSIVDSIYPNLNSTSQYYENYVITKVGDHKISIVDLETGKVTNEIEITEKIKSFGVGDSKIGVIIDKAGKYGLDVFNFFDTSDKNTVVISDQISPTNYNSHINVKFCNNQIVLNYAFETYVSEGLSEIKLSDKVSDIRTRSFYVNPISDHIYIVGSNTIEVYAASNKSLVHTFGNASASNNYEMFMLD